jgi:hypothetical protein
MKITAFSALGFFGGLEKKVKGEENFTAVTDSVQQSFISCRHAPLISVYGTYSALPISLTGMDCASKSTRHCSIKAESAAQRYGRWDI